MFSPTVKYFFKHQFILRWIGKLTNSRHECQSLRYSCRSTVSGQVFYVRAERSLTLLREPHQLVTLNVLPHGERHLLLWRDEEVKTVEFLSSWHDKASVQVHEVLWRKEIAKTEQKQLLLQFIVRQLRNNSHLQGEEQQKCSPRRYHRESMSNTPSLKPFIQRVYCPYNWYLTKKLRPLNS